MSGSSNERPEAALKLLPQFIIETIQQTNETSRRLVEITLQFYKSLFEEPRNVDASTKLILAFCASVPML